MSSRQTTSPTRAITTLVRVPVLDAEITIPDVLAPTIAAEGPPLRVMVPLEDPSFASRYTLEGTLGEGGMGVVRLALDGRIGREVAMKTMLSAEDARGDLGVRFLREACIQGQLEHPALIPVYDLGRDPKIALFFTMRRIRGVTFEDIVARLRGGEAEATRQYSRRKLLTAFASVCQAVHFAHTHGVIHRDLKPGNVMLGDFGEVYVLDWGIAKLVSTPAPVTAGDRPSISSETRWATSTLEGTTLGTPGYMAPEQIDGAVHVDARADVYSLGAILFELLCLEPLHARTTVAGKLASTLEGADARASPARRTTMYLLSSRTFV